MICACWDYTISRRTPWVPRTPLLVGSLPTPAPNKMDGNRNPAHFPTALPWEPCAFCQATPNKHHSKQKCVISQEAGWNPIYPLFKRFFWTFKLLYFHYFPTIEHNNWKSNPQSFLVFDEQGTVYQELLRWSMKYTMDKTMFSCVNLPMSCEQRAKPWAHIPWNTDCFMTASLFSKHEVFSHFNASLTMHWSCCAKMISAHAKRSVVKCTPIGERGGST